MGDGSAKDSALFKTVIFATDFSFYSQNAGLYAAYLAQQFGAELLVSHAFYLSQPALEAEHWPELKSRQRLDLEESLTRSAARLGGTDIKAKPQLIEGDPKTAINHIAKERGESIIVLGTHGGSKVGRWVLGSTAEGILRSAHCPCLTVGPQVRPLNSAEGQFKRVLYATELDSSIARAGTFAVAVAEKFNSEIDVLHVVAPGQLKHPADFGDIQEKFNSALDRIVPSRATVLRTPRSFIEAGSAHKEILKHIKEYSIDLLVLGIRRSTSIWMESARSGAFGIVAEAGCPVLTIVG